MKAHPLKTKNQRFGFLYDNDAILYAMLQNPDKILRENHNADDFGLDIL
jgi:hypothetical protein